MDEIENAICRIRQMEDRFNLLQKMQSEIPGEIKSNSQLQELVDELRSYYENGDWLHDYALDEQGLLPSRLRRGVLSQDGLYNLLYDFR